MSATMEMILIDGTDLDTYPGAVPVTTKFHFASKMEPSSLARITVDPELRGGVPCVSDGHWPITHILEQLASGLTVEQVTQNYPELTVADIQLALEAAASVMRDPGIDWSALDLPGMVEFQREMRAWQSLSDDAFDVDDNSLGD